MREICEQPDSVILAAADHADMVGVAIGTILENGPLLAPPRIGYVGFLVVLPPFRGRGIGMRLWSELNAWFCHRDIHEVQLYTQANNELARGFWQQQGFDVALERRARRLE